MKRFRNLDFDAVRAVEPQAGAGARGRARDLPGRHAPGARGAGQARDRGRPARPAARAARHVAPGGGDGRRSRRRCGARTNYEQQTLRLFGIPESEIAETLRVAEGELPRLRGARDHHLPAPGRGRDGHALRAGGRAPAWRARCSSWCAAATGARCSPRTARAWTTRWPTCWTGARLALGRVLHRRADGGAPDRAAGLVGLLRRRGRDLRERGQGRAAGRGPGADRARGRRLAGGGRGDGGRRARALRGRHGGRHHRRGRARRRERGEAGRLRVLVRRSSPTAARSPATCACPATARRSATAPPRSAMHLLRRLLSGEEFPL